MLPIPDAILKRFDTILEKRDVAPAPRADFKKWLRYFLDFCAKYPPPAARSDQVRLFIDKLREKRQTLDQQKQAAYAVSLYFEMQQAQDMSPFQKDAENLCALVSPVSAFPSEQTSP